jgi:hypothetical protein
MKLRLFKIDKRNIKYKDWGYRNISNGKEYYYKREYRFTIEDDLDDWFLGEYSQKPENDIDYRIQQSNKQYKLDEVLNKILE